MPPKKRKKDNDHLFKKSMQDKPIVKGLLHTILKPSIAATVDFSTLAIKKDLWVDTDLSEHLADIVYVARLKNSNKHIYFLFEHKSKSDKMIVLQNSRYINMIWNTHREQHEDSERDPLVYAIIIYNGNRIWNIDNSSHHETAYFKDSLIPKVEWIFFDIKHDEYEIDNKQYRLKAFIDSLKISDAKDVLDRIPKILQLFRRKGTDREYLSVIINYLYSTIAPKDNKRFFEIIDAEYNKGGTMKTFTDILQEWGEKRGFKKGHIQGITEGESKGLKTGKKQGFEKGIRKGVKQGVKQGVEQGIRKGRKQGITEGEKKGKYEQKEKDLLTIAKRMLAKKMSVKEIAEVTGLPEEKIHTLKSKISKKKTSKKSSKKVN